MKFSCEKELLLERIGIASRAVSNKSTIPLLEGLLLEGDMNGLTITGYDLSMAIRTVSLAVDIVEGGRIVLNASLLGSIVRKLPNDIVYLEVDDQLRATIKCGHSVFNLVASSAEEYPVLPEVVTEEEIVLPCIKLKSMIAQTIFAVSENEAKPIHTGCLFEAVGDNLNVVAVDGYRLSVRKEKLDEPVVNEMKFVVPGTSLREIERMMDDSEKTIRLSLGKKHIVFEMDETTLVTRLIEGEFLNYQSAIPAAFEHNCKVNRADMITCIERVSLIVSEKLKNPVRILFDGGVMQMSCITAIGKSYDECVFEGNIQEFEIGFNNRYLLDALRAAGDEEVVLSLNGSLNPIVMTPTQGDKFTYLVLPVRLKADA